jgi:hypothetical protein
MDIETARSIQEKYTATLEEIVNTASMMIFFLQGMSQQISRMVQERVPVEAETEETAIGVLRKMGWQMKEALLEMEKHGIRPPKPK